MKYVIEHMEEGFSPWVVLEYKAIAKELGPGNLYLSSVSPLLQLPAELEGLGIVVTSKEVTQLHELDPEFSKEKCCLLDPSAEKMLAPEDSQQFSFFLFGGILGDHPPRDRTGELRKLGFAGRNLDKVQMTTDTAVRVTDRVLSKQTPLNAIKYTDFPELRFNKHESTEMPFRYIADEQGEPIMPEGMRELIKADTEKGLDFDL